MKLFLTGANGFLGTAVVKAALARDHDVVAMVRDAAKFISPSDRVTVVQGDLRRRAEWETAMATCDAVIHLAASFTDFYSQFASTVLGTEQLLAAMEQARVQRLVHISTFSIYNYRALSEGGELNEESPLEAHPEDLDDYTKTKLVQERLIETFGSTGGLVTSIRPGAIYGPDKMWSGGMTLKLSSKLWLSVGPHANQKLTFVDNCADAIVLAAETDAAIGKHINIVDNESPNQRQYTKAMVAAGYAMPLSIPIPYKLAHFGARILNVVNQRRYQGRAKIPWYGVPAKLDQKCKHLTTPNTQAKQLLAWSPKFSLAEGIAESRRREQAGREQAGREQASRKQGTS